ncbi:hypothetical protein Y032_0390g534 [Ancylostoma ceylanicum]|uniref:Uncharacterized protein n=1 Tax=Ancylostoma ceylanicum TaxID=53326 RepID=A0A016RSS3_9BILA|nr:hypothetical protein Y032_0390g534 [Ancylostoma ceylanicum]
MGLFDAHTQVYWTFCVSFSNFLSARAVASTPGMETKVSESVETKMSENMETKMSESVEAKMSESDLLGCPIDENTLTCDLSLDVDATTPSSRTSFAYDEHTEPTSPPSHGHLFHEPHHDEPSPGRQSHMPGYRRTSYSDNRAASHYAGHMHCCKPYRERSYSRERSMTPKSPPYSRNDALQTTGRTREDAGYSLYSRHRYCDHSRERSRSQRPGTSHSRTPEYSTSSGRPHKRARYSRYNDDDHSRERSRSPRPLRMSSRSRTPEYPPSRGRTHECMHYSRYNENDYFRERSRSPRPQTSLHARTLERSPSGSRMQRFYHNERRYDGRHSPDEAASSWSRTPSHDLDQSISTSRGRAHRDGHLERSTEDHHFRERRRTPSPQWTSKRKLPMDSQVTSLSERANDLIRERCVNLEKLGAAVALNDNAEEVEDFVRDKLKDVRVQVAEVKSIRKAIDAIPTSSDSVVRCLVGVVKSLSEVIIGMSTVMDGMVVNQENLRNSVKTANNCITRMTRLKLPNGVSLSASNMKTSWKIPVQPPFVECDLKELMGRWRRSGRATEEDHLTHCTDFMRFYLVRACDPVKSIQKYAHRVSGRGQKKEDLKDLPENIVGILIECLLDGLGLGQPELQMATEELEDRPTDFFMKLGETVEERKSALEYRKDCRIQWMPTCALAINRGLADVRQYVMKGDKLVPKPKRKIINVETIKSE